MTDISIEFAAPNGSILFIDLTPDFASWSVNGWKNDASVASTITPPICSTSGKYSSSKAGWPSDLTLADSNGTAVIEIFAFDPSAPFNTGNGALRCSTGVNTNYPQDSSPVGSPGTYTWKFIPVFGI
jgi:hypothetical protein